MLPQPRQDADKRNGDFEAVDKGEQSKRQELQTRPPRSSICCGFCGHQLSDATRSSCPRCDVICCRQCYDAHDCGVWRPWPGDRQYNSRSARTKRARRRVRRHRRRWYDRRRCQHGCSYASLSNPRDQCSGQCAFLHGHPLGPHNCGRHAGGLDFVSEIGEAPGGGAGSHEPGARPGAPEEARAGTTDHAYDADQGYAGTQVGEDSEADDVQHQEWLYNTGRELYYQQVDVDDGAGGSGAPVSRGQASAETRAPIPEGWERVWLGEHGVHYFWHSATHTARWSLNLADPDSALEARGSDDGRDDGRAGRGGGCLGSTGDGSAALAPPGHATAYTRAALPHGWELAWSEAHQEPFFWHSATGLARWTLDLAAAARAIPPFSRPRTPTPVLCASSRSVTGVRASSQDPSGGDDTQPCKGRPTLTPRQSSMLAQLADRVREGRAPALTGLHGKALRGGQAHH